MRSFFWICVFFIFFGFLSFSAVAAPVVRQAIKVEPVISEVVSAFRQYRTIDDLSLAVPTVIDVPLLDFVERDVFSVLDVTANRFEPYVAQSVQSEEDIPVSLQSDFSPDDAFMMNDGQENTFAQYDVPDSGEGQIVIVMTSQKPIMASKLTVLLDDYVALPTFVEIRANTDRGDIVVVAKKKMEKQTIVFPKTSADRWTISFSYAQPLRISELMLHQENSLTVRSRFIRFLAQKDHAYRLYFDADRQVRPYFEEAGDLAGASDVLSVMPVSSSPNPEYVIADIDKDAVPDVRDNCVEVFNEDQIDVNENGRGDSCDDFDRDGKMNPNDNCPNNPNRFQEDTDGDGIGDVCDEEESRITERYTWLPWLGIGFAVAVLIVLFALTARSMKKE